ncbi:MAG: hypothetical protein Q8L93_03865 [Rhodocyclaceae bacterium]|nr:hypothetical protein [Rhodocyclaceae bacterium]
MRKTRFATYALIATLLALFTALPARADPLADFTAAESIFRKAAAKESSATDEAVRRFEQLSAADSPLSPLFTAYLGAAQTMQGRDAWMPWTKMRATERGLDTLEKALRRLELRHNRELVRGTPVAIEVRLVAATTFIAVPSMFNRYDLGKQALRDAFASPAFAAAPAEVKASLHQQAALAAGRDKNPREETAHLKQALEAEPTGAIAEAARRRLQALGS